jgi:hypothetical protein
MKTTKMIVTAIALSFAIFANAEEVHQKIQGENPTKGKEHIQVKAIKGADSGKVGRVKGSLNQWGFVSYWMGIPTPDGKSIIRIRVYNDGNPTATYAVYIDVDGQKFIKKLEIPANAKKDAFVNIDIPVNVDAEWSGIFLKKFEKTDKPSPIIDTISVIVPE